MLLTVLFFTILCAGPAHSQIKIGEHATVGGRIGMDLSYYERFNAGKLADPFRVRFYAQPYFKIKDVDIRFNILVGDYHKKYAQEFNKFGTSIRYKWLSAHIGHVNQSMTPLTWQGHTVLGGGIALNPGIFRFSGFYGRFRRDINPNDFTGVFARASYNRWGAAGKIGVGTDKNFLDIIVLRIADKEGSLQASDAGSLTAAANAVLSLHTKQQMGKHFEVEAEMALSAITSDVTDTSEAEDGFRFRRIPAYLIDENGSTATSMGLRAAVTYKTGNRQKAEGSVRMNSLQVSAVYDRTEADYASMAMYYIRNDFQRLRLKAQMRFAQGKLSISPQIGWETADLKKEKLASTQRFIGGLAVMWRINQQTSINGSYLNYNNALESNAADSILQRRISHNAQLSLSNKHKLASGKENQVRAYLGFQQGTTKTSETSSAYLTAFNARVSYAIELVQDRLTLEPAIRLNTYKRQTGNQVRISPGLYLRSRLLNNKLSVDGSSNAVLATVSGTGLSNTAWRTDVRITYRFVKRQLVSLRLAYQENFTKGLSNVRTFQTDIRYSITL